MMINNSRIKEENVSKTKSIIALCAMVLLVLPLGAQQVNVTGDWEMTSEGRQGPMTTKLHFEQEGEKIKVTMESQRGEVTGEGTIKGNEIEWTVTRETPRGDFTMTYKGKVEGDTMKGEVQMGDFGSREWTAKKK
jgi:hypothetical protein